MSRSFRESMDQMLKARFPILYVETFEEQRVLAEVAAVVGTMRIPRSVYTCSATEGPEPG